MLRKTRQGGPAFEDLVQRGPAPAGRGAESGAHTCVESGVANHKQVLSAWLTAYPSIHTAVFRETAACLLLWGRGARTLAASSACACSALRSSPTPRLQHHPRRCPSVCAWQQRHVQRGRAVRRRAAASGALAVHCCNTAGKRASCVCLRRMHRCCMQHQQRPRKSTPQRR